MQDTKLEGVNLLRATCAILQAIRSPRTRIQTNTGAEKFDIPEDYRSRISLRIENPRVLANIDNIVFALNGFLNETDGVNGIFRFDKGEKALRYFGDLDLKTALAKTEITLEAFAISHGLDISPKSGGRAA